MLLAIDIGNTNTVLGIFDGEKLERAWRIKTDARSTADELALTFRGLLTDHEIDSVAACSTVPAALRELRAMLDEYYSNVPTVIVEPGIRTGVSLQYENPKEVGSDRIVNTLAAHHLVGARPVIVVDFGTTTNFDVVSAEGDFLGGSFAPGLEVSAESLFGRASRLFRVPLTPPATAIGKNTADCLRSGIVFGYVGLVEGLLARIVAELPAKPTVIATGGLAATIAPLATGIEKVDEDLTLEGLRLLYELNA